MPPSSSLAPATAAKPEESEKIDPLFAQYKDLVELNSTFSLNEYLGTRNEADLEFYSGVIETESISFLFRTKLKVSKRSELPPNVQVQVQPGRPIIVPGFPTALTTEVISQGWIENTAEV